MGRTLFTPRVLAAVAASLLLASCTTHKQETPPLTGPSGLGTSLVITVSPDVLQQDGASQSLVQIQAHDNNGQPLRNVSMRVEIAVEGAFTDFGSLSARNVVTDANGRASAVYTAPPAPVLSNISETVVQIVVTPSASDFANATARFVNIRLTPPGTVGPPTSPFRVDFVVPAITVGNPAFFQAVVVDATGADVTDKVASFAWNFGDGGTGSGETTSHTYNTPGTFAVTLRITDTLNRTQTVTHTAAIGQGAIPSVVDIIFSPQNPIIDQTINFTASTNVEPGHTVTGFDWTFGDGGTAGGPSPTHSYHDQGTYVVTLRVTDDAGRKSTPLFSKSITVGNGNPTADFTFNPSAPRFGQDVTFDASPSQAASGRTIVSYSWAFGDGFSGTGQTVVHRFNSSSTTAITYNVLLTVTDSAGKTSSVTKPVTVSPPSVP